MALGTYVRVPNPGLSVVLPTGGSGLPLIVTESALRTSKRVVAECGPGGRFITLELMSEIAISSGPPGAGEGGGGGGCGVVQAVVTVTVTGCCAVPALLLAVSV